MRYLAVSFFALLIFSVLFSGCKKGCTNPDALNYNSSAKEDNGDCLFCKTKPVGNIEITSGCRDNTPSSPYEGTLVLVVKTEGSIYAYSGNGCKQLGLTANCNSGTVPDNIAYVDVTLTNITPDTMTISASVTLNVGGSPSVFDTTLVNFEIAPNEAVTAYKHVLINCTSESIGTPFLSLPTSTFSYR